MAIHIGTSGWSYDHWENVLYPPGLPVRDQLREGDVYWVIDATAEADGRRAAHDLTVDQTPALLLELAAHGAEVWDVTAAARQVMKRLFGEAAFARADERRTENA